MGKCDSSTKATHRAKVKSEGITKAARHREGGEVGLERHAQVEPPPPFCTFSSEEGLRGVCVCVGSLEEELWIRNGS